MNNRPTNINMNPYGARQTPRLQNTQKPAINGSWGAGGTPVTAPMQSPFGGLGGVPARPGQLSGFAQAIGGSAGAQGPIDMRCVLDSQELPPGYVVMLKATRAIQTSWNMFASLQL